MRFSLILTSIDPFKGCYQWFKHNGRSAVHLKLFTRVYIVANKIFRWLRKDMRYVHIYLFATKFSSLITAEKSKCARWRNIRLRFMKAHIAIAEHPSINVADYIFFTNFWFLFVIICYTLFLFKVEIYLLKKFIYKVESQFFINLVVLRTIAIPSNKYSLCLII